MRAPSATTIMLRTRAVPPIMEPVSARPRDCSSGTRRDAKPKARPSALKSGLRRTRPIAPNTIARIDRIFALFHLSLLLGVSTG